LTIEGGSIGYSFNGFFEQLNVTKNGGSSDIFIILLLLHVNIFTDFGSVGMDDKLLLAHCTQYIVSGNSGIQTNLLSLHDKYSN
jgi:hypothetical protein